MRPYGRFFHIPRCVAVQLEEDSYLVLFDYCSGGIESTTIDGLTVISVGLLANPVAVFRRLKRIVEDVRPRWIIGFSDTWYGIVASYLARRYGARCLIDAYDNFEAYLPAAKPLHWVWRRALARADAVTAAGPQLLQLLSSGRGGNHMVVVPMAADPHFRSMEKEHCRSLLGLPQGRRLIGICGAAGRSRGIEVFESAIANLLREFDLVDLVCTGPDAGSGRFNFLGSRIHNLGYVEDADMPVVINACDVIVAINRDSSFGNYSYPAKLYEAMACGIPVVASATESVRWVLGEVSGGFCNPGDSADLERALRESLLRDAPSRRDIAGWEDSALIFASVLEGDAS